MKIGKYVFQTKITGNKNAKPDIKLNETEEIERKYGTCKNGISLYYA